MGGALSPTLSWAYESESIVISSKFFMACYPLYFSQSSINIPPVDLG